LPFYQFNLCISVVMIVVDILPVRHVRVYKEVCHGTVKGFDRAVELTTDSNNSNEI